MSKLEKTRAESLSRGSYECIDTPRTQTSRAVSATASIRFLIRNPQPLLPLPQHSPIQRLPCLYRPLIRLILHKRAPLVRRHRDRAHLSEPRIPREQGFQHLVAVVVGHVADEQDVVGREVLVGDDGRFVGFGGFGGARGGRVAGPFGGGGCWCCSWDFEGLFAVCGGLVRALLTMYSRVK